MMLFSRSFHFITIVFSMYTVPSPPADVEAFCAAVAWRFPRSPNGRIMRYDVQLRLPGRRQTVMLDSRFDGTYVAVPEDYQLYGATARVCCFCMKLPPHCQSLSINKAAKN